MKITLIYHYNHFNAVGTVSCLTKVLVVATLS
jgi:hypothetical protein